MEYYIYYVNIEILYLTLIPFCMLVSKNRKHKMYFLKLSFSVVLPRDEVLVIYWIIYKNFYN